MDHANSLVHANKTSSIVSVESLIGNDVCNEQGEDLGDITEIMLDTNTGNVSYVVLTFGGVLGVGSKLFAVPWSALKIDIENKRFILNVDKELLNGAPGFDKDNWPEVPDEFWRQTIHSYYGIS